MTKTCEKVINKTKDNVEYFKIEGEKRVFLRITIRRIRRMFDRDPNSLFVF